MAKGLSNHNLAILYRRLRTIDTRSKLLPLAAPFARKVPLFDTVWRHFKAIRWLTGSRPIEIRGGWAGQPHHHPALCSLVTTWLMLRYRSSSLHHNTLYLVCYDPNPNPNTHNLTLTLTLTLLTSGQIIPRNHCCSTDSVHNLSSDDKHLWNQVVSLCLATLFHFDIMLYIIIVSYNNISSSRCTQWDRLKNC